MTEDKTVFKVFKQFFISLNLPYSIKRGETIALSIVVFNYMSQKVTASVKLDNSRKEFEFVDPLTQLYKNKGCPPGIILFDKINCNKSTTKILFQSLNCLVRRMLMYHQMMALNFHS